MNSMYARLISDYATLLNACMQTLTMSNLRWFNLVILHCFRIEWEAFTICTQA